MPQGAGSCVPIRSRSGAEGAYGGLSTSLSTAGECDELYCPKYWKPKLIQNHEAGRQNILYE